MKWLDRLKTPKASDPHATKPTKPQESEQAAGFVGFVAYPPAPFQKIEGSEAANNTTPAADPDRWCWPHSEAMNAVEIDIFTARLARFTDKGLTLADAEQQADRLVVRDREGDDRQLCLECAHLHGAGRWRCGNWHRAEVATQLKDAQLPGALVQTLQRCPGFGASTP
ncbi:hypothetical protein [Hydrogenophaga sp. OTU3427]|uniref:hypothetical protein n=1 Tax=Hydrogenophaga sp. OTU3427 TaxID=3043856 RepID=UPI00313DFD25